MNRVMSGAVFQIAVLQEFISAMTRREP